MEFPGCPQWVQLSPGGAVVSARLCRLPEQELHQPSGRCILIGAIYSVGAVLALASGKAERRQLHPLKTAPLKTKPLV